MTIARVLFAAMLVASTATMLVASIATPALAQNTDDPSRRDEFGLKPDDGTDRDLALPDPVLDRNWPTPSPGDASDPAQIAPDEDEIDPFREEEETPPAPAPPPPPVPVPIPKRPPISPDGRIDPGTPLPAPDPAAADPLEPEPSPEDLTDVEKEERAPSAFDRGQGLYDDDMHRDDFHDAPTDDAGE